jgi:RNA polymerase sigma-70 factor (ECF subfamily)
MRDVLPLPPFATLAAEYAQVRLPATVEQHTEGLVLERKGELERFLASVEQRAFRIARITLRDDDDALDAVQDSMLKLARSYADRPTEEWRPLFYRILQNRVRDFQRRRQVRNRIFAWLPNLGAGDEPAPEIHDITPAPGSTAIDQLMASQALAILEAAVRELPRRQQQAFMLRNFEGMDVAETANAMSCSEGSVKTHYSRAVHTLRARLGEAW